jgi:hypothetical protein
VNHTNLDGFLWVPTDVFGPKLTEQPIHGAYFSTDQPFPTIASLLMFTKCLLLLFGIRVVLVVPMSNIMDINVNKQTIMRTNNRHVFTITRHKSKKQCKNNCFIVHI